VATKPRPHWNHPFGKSVVLIKREIVPSLGERFVVRLSEKPERLGIAWDHRDDEFSLRLAIDVCTEVLAVQPGHILARQPDTIGPALNLLVAEVQYPRAWIFTRMITTRSSLVSSSGNLQSSDLRVSSSCTSTTRERDNSGIGLGKRPTMNEKLTTVNPRTAGTVIRRSSGTFRM
jgi:hypothetical protein